MITAVGVVVPVHDEEQLLPACLDSLDAALDALPRSIRRLAVVVLDSCTDGSEAIARRWARDATRLTTVIGCRRVGRARAAGMDLVRDRLCDVTPSDLWLATTDADSEVPSEWLTDQLRMADDGVDAVAGTIRIGDVGDHRPDVIERFRRFYEGELDAPHPHVHGANLGVRSDAYAAAGGFPPLATGEDHALWRSLERTARSRISTRSIAVTTSARARGRAPDGFSHFLVGFAAGR